MLGPQGLDDGVVQVVIGRGLGAGGHAVAADDRTVKELRGRDNGGYQLLGVPAVEVSIVQQALCHAVAHIHHLGQIGILVDALGGGGPVIELGIIALRLHSHLAQPAGRLQPGHADDLLMLVLIHILPLGQVQHHVVQLGEDRVLGGGAAHVDEALLKAHDGARGHHGAALEYIGHAGACLRHVGAEHTGEDLSLRLVTGLHHILHRKDTAGFARLGKIHLHGCHTGVLQNELLQPFHVHRQHAVLQVVLVTQDDIFYLNISQFQIHDRCVLLSIVVAFSQSHLPIIYPTKTKKSIIFIKIM